MLLTAVIAAFANSMSGEYVLDDEVHLDGKEELLAKFLWSPTQVFANNRGVAFFTFALDNAVFDDDRWGHHFTNIVIHWAVCCFGYWILVQILSNCQNAVLRRHALEISLCSTVIFAVHPLTTNVVTYMVQRMESLMALFCLLTIWSVIRLTHTGRTSFAVLAVVFCAVGMRSKEVMVVTPLLILGFDYAYLARSMSALRRRAWLHIALWLTLLLNPAWAPLYTSIVSSTENARDRLPKTAYVVEDLSRWEYLRTQPEVVAKYLQLVFWPSDLCLDRRWEVQDDPALIALWLSVTIAMILASLGMFLKAPEWGFPLLCFFVVLAPTSSFVPLADLYYEHRIYLPLYPVLAISVCVMYLFCAQMAKRYHWREESLRFARYLLFAAISATLCLITIQRNHVFQSPISLWRDCIAKNPRNDRAHGNLVSYMVESHDPRYRDEILHLAQRFVKISPENADSFATLGIAHYEREEFTQARDAFSRALELDASHFGALLHLGNIAFHASPASAVSFFESAVEQKPLHVAALNNLATALLASEQESDRAIQLLRKAIAIDGEYEDALMNLGQAYLQQRQFKKAQEQYKTVLDFAPSNEHARHLYYYCESQFR
ncbi:tetratricopeptide repeat protein [bacterium]|nr:tetratricopeptide repeat protein [bacterium]